MAKLPRHSVDMLFADLPYGKTRNTWDKHVPLQYLWEQIAHVCKPDAALVFTAMQPFASLLVCSRPDWFRYEMIWHKNKPGGFLNAKKQPLRTHENVLVFYRRQPVYVPQMSTGHKPVNGYTHGKVNNNYGELKPKKGGGATTRYPVSVLDIPVVNNDDPERIHPTQKPEALSAWFIKAYTLPGQRVLDPTAGSGSTLLAAHRLGRKYVGFETDLKIFNAAKKRLERLTF